VSGAATAFWILLAVSVNGSHPRPASRRLPGSRRVRLLVGGATAVVLAAVLIAPVVLLGSGARKSTACRTTIRYQGRLYDARDSGRVVEAIAVGIGVASGCGTKPENVDLRTVAGVQAGRAVALASDPSTVYVRRGVCGSLRRAALLRCLRGRAAAAASATLTQ
jgi:hypothetical protein